MPTSRPRGTDRASVPPPALVVMLAGPLAAVLHETGTFSPGPPATLWPLGFVVLVALVGLLLGARTWRSGSRWTGALIALPNLVVLGPYLFLLVFFGLGGSR